MRHCITYGEKIENFRSIRIKDSEADSQQDYTKQRVPPLFTLQLGSLKSSSGLYLAHRSWDFQLVSISAGLQNSQNLMGHIQIYCDSSLKLTLTCMHFSVSSKGARTTKADITAHMYSSLFPKVPTISVYSNLPLILCLVMEEAFWWAENSQTATACHSFWSQTNSWITFNCSGVFVSYFLCYSLMPWLRLTSPSSQI